MAGVALSHGLNPNMVHRWMREDRQQQMLTALSEGHAFVPLQVEVFWPRILSTTISGVRKFCSTKLPRPSAIRDCFRPMIAVCGNGMPSGCRNSATTAYQSAMASTAPGSAKARSHASAG